MQTFKQQLNENKFASMPHAVLHAKTASVLGEHDHEDEGGGPDVTDNGFHKHEYYHKAPGYESDYEDGAQDNMSDSHERAHKALTDLGWERAHHHDVNTDVGRDGHVAITAYSHPNGASLRHVYTSSDDGSDVYRESMWEHSYKP